MVCMNVLPEERDEILLPVALTATAELPEVAILTPKFSETEVLRKQLAKKPAPSKQELEEYFRNLLNSTASSAEGRTRILSALKSCTKVAPLSEISPNLSSSIPRVNPNKNIPPQLRFIKKKSNKIRKRMTKPESDEKDEIFERLIG